MNELLSDLVEAFQKRGVDLSTDVMRAALEEAFHKHTSTFETALTRDAVMDPEKINHTRMHSMGTIFREILTRPNLVQVDEKLETLPNEHGVFKTKASERFRLCVVHMGSGGRAALRPLPPTGGKLPAAR